MSQKHIISLIVLIVIVGATGYFTLTNDTDLFDPEETTTVVPEEEVTTFIPETDTTVVEGAFEEETIVVQEVEHTRPTNYTNEPLFECFTDCERRENFIGECCSGTFKEDCIAAGDTFRWVDMHPGIGAKHQCFQTAPDTGNACSSNTDCLSGFCDLEIALEKCILIEKTLTGGTNGALGKAFFKATHSCDTPTPGECTAARPNGTNPGGQLHSLQMKDMTLFEELMMGPIS